MKRCFVLIAAAAALWSTTAMAKLPPLSPEAKAKADEAAAKTAWQGKVDAYKLCQVQDRVASYYRSHVPAGRPAPTPAAAMPPCADPGPFAYTPPQDKPVEQAGAHSPAGTATAPPSATAQPQAEMKSSTAPATAASGAAAPAVTSASGVASAASAASR